MTAPVEAKKSAGFKLAAGSFSLRRRSKSTVTCEVRPFAPNQHLRRSETFRQEVHAIAWARAYLGAIERADSLPDAADFEGARAGVRPMPLPPPNQKTVTMTRALNELLATRTRSHKRKRVSSRTTDNFRYRLNVIRSFFRKRQCWTSIASMTSKDVEDFLDHLMESGISSSYAGAVLANLRSLVKLARGKDWMRHDPTVGLYAHADRPDTKKVRVHLHTFLALLRSVPEMFWMGLILMRYCGLRPGEAFGVRVRDVCLEEGEEVIEVRGQGGRQGGYLDPWDEDPDAEPSSSLPYTKSRRARTVPIPFIIVPFFRWWIRERVADPITGIVDPDAFIAWPDFTTHKGCLRRLSTKWRDVVLSFGLVETTSSGAVKRSMHALRYSLGCDTQNHRGIPKSFVIDLLGHDHGQDVSVADRSYNTHIDLTPAERRDIAEWGALVGDALVRNSEAGDIVPAIIEHLIAAPGEPESDWLTTGEVGRIFGLHARTIRSLVGAGEFPGARSVRWGPTRQKTLIPPTDLKAFRESWADRVTVNEVAADSGYTPAAVYRLVADGVIGRPGLYRNVKVWTRKDADKALGILVDRQSRRSCYRTLPEAAGELGLSVALVLAMLDQGFLEAIGRGTNRLVTGASLDAHKATVANRPIKRQRGGKRDSTI